MPRKSLFTKDLFIEAAFSIVRDKGADKLSARSLARELKCSTMPVYSYLKSMRTLASDLEEKAIDLMLTYQTTPRTGQAFFDMGLGYVIFARNEKNLFQFLFMRTGPDRKHRRSGRQHRGAKRDISSYIFAPDDQGEDGAGTLGEATFGSLISKMKTDPTLTGLDDEQLEGMLTKMWIFTHGLAFLINNNSLIKSDDDSIRQLIYETGFFVIEGEKNKLNVA